MRPMRFKKKSKRWMKEGMKVGKAKVHRLMTVGQVEMYWMVKKEKVAQVGKSRVRLRETRKWCRTLNHFQKKSGNFR